LVLAVTGAAQALGPGLAGILTPFPIAVSVVCGFVLVQEGSAAAVVLLEGILRGMTGFAVFCFGVAVLVPRLPAVGAFVLATAAGIAVPLLAGLLSGRRGPGRTGPPAPR
jgi:predicted cobalt transporter CbtA